MRLALVFLTLFFSSLSWPDEVAKAGKSDWTAHLLRRHSTNLQIQGLEIPQVEIPVMLSPKNSELRPLVTVRGHFNHSGWRLYAPNATLLCANGNDDFQVTAYLRDHTSDLTLTAIGPNGEREVETVYIYAPDIHPYHVGSDWSDLSVAAGVGSLSYFQNTFGSYESIVGDLNLMYSTPTYFDRYGLTADVDLTVLTFKSSPINRGPQVLQGRLDGSLFLDTSPENRTRYQLLLGFDYLTMMANGSPFGFTNLFAPELGVRGTYVMDPLTNLVYEGRFVAIGNVHGSAQYGLDFGLTWVRKLQSSHRFSLGLEYSTYTYDPDTTTKITIDLTTLRVGYSL